MHWNYIPVMIGEEIYFHADEKDRYISIPIVAE